VGCPGEKPTAMEKIKQRKRHLKVEIQSLRNQK